MLAATIEVLDDDVASEEGRRVEGRTVVARPSTVRGARRTPHDVQVENLSVNGFAFTAVSDFAVGTLIEVGLSGAGTARAQIVRRDGNLFGCAFERPLTPEQLSQAFGSMHVLAQIGTMAQVAPATEKWPRSVRVAVLLAGAALSWWIVIAVARAIAG